ncbi:unnamed protein product, partial [Bubo scandiacus]
AARYSLQCWSWIQAEHLESNEGLRRTWGRAHLRLQGLGMCSYLSCSEGSGRNC